MELSVIILNWNSQHYLKGCLESLIKNTQHIQKEIIIIDNGSNDGSVQYIERLFPEILLIRNRENKGVGPARNQGLGIAKGNFFLVLDVDTIIHNNAIDIMLETFSNNSKIGIVGPKLVDKDGKMQFSCREFPTLLSKLYRQLPANLRNLLLRNEELRDWEHNSLREVGYVIGACQLIRKDVIKDVGLYDPRMFYGVEEVDYCLRAWKKGWKVIYNPDAVVTHIEQRSGRQNIFGRLQLSHNKSLFIYFCKHKYLLKPYLIPASEVSF